jgi:hypothetical protein
MKEANPNIKVVIGGLLLDCDPINPPPGKDCRPSKYLEGILKAGGGPYFDVVSFHTYDYYYSALGVYANTNWNSYWNTNGPVIFAKYQYLKQVMAQYNISDKPVFCTEVALSCNSETQDCTSDTFQTTKAYYLAQAYATGIVQGIDASIWYFLIDRWRNTGLLSFEYQPYKAYYAYKFAASELGTANSGIDISRTDVRILEINAPRGRVWVLWSRDGLNHSVSLPSKPNKGYDTFGNSISVSNPMTVGIQPIYLEMP